MNKQKIDLYFQNLLEKSEEKELTQENALSMVQCKVLKQLELLEARRFDDPDIVEDLQYLQEKLQESVQDLRSVDLVQGNKPSVLRPLGT